MDFGFWNFEVIFLVYSNTIPPHKEYKVDNKSWNQLATYSKSYLIKNY